TVQRTLNLPAVLNGPISALPPLMFTLLILGAPGCTESWGALLTHCPFVIICKTWTSSTSVTFDPLEILTHFCTKLDESMCTVPLAQPPPPPPLPLLAVGVLPVVAVIVPGREQAASRILPSAKTARNSHRIFSR